jgi:hypothetical protein
MQILRRIVSRDNPLHYAAQLGLTEEPPQVCSTSSAQILPEQVGGSASMVSKYGGIVALMYAVLEDAVECFWKQFQSTRRHDLHSAREAEEWFLSEGDASPFSFITICTVLKIDPDYIRTGLKRRLQSSPTPARWSTRRQVRRRQPLRLAS